MREKPKCTIIIGKVFGIIGLVAGSENVKGKVMAGKIVSVEKGLSVDV